MKKVLFFIPTLMHGGAEKVLVNLVNNMNQDKYDITVQTIFDVGVNKQYLNSNIRYKYIFKKIFPGVSTIFKVFSPKVLFKMLIRDEYDIIVSYLEGPTARIISGCDNDKVKKISWIHIELNEDKYFTCGFRHSTEARLCYDKFDKIICVSRTVKDAFLHASNLNPNKVEVIYNTNETYQIIEKSKQDVEDINFENSINICSVGKIVKTKGYDRLARVHKRLLDEGLKHNIYILGIGADRKKIENYINSNNLNGTFKFIGFKDNPYKYVSKCDIYVCSSLREGFSTAVTEALLVGTPVVSTLCSGAEELLGNNNEYGIIVDNSEDGIYKGIKRLLINKQLLDDYRIKSKERGRYFRKENTVREVELLFDNL